eukprot:9485726-Pyramimonas_sp.AAC.2
MTHVLFQSGAGPFAEAIVHQVEQPVGVGKEGGVQQEVGRPSTPSEHAKRGCGNQRCPPRRNQCAG